MLDDQQQVEVLRLKNNKVASLKAMRERNKEEIQMQTQLQKNFEEEKRKRELVCIY